MIPKRILVPVDFAEPSERALDYAIDLAAKLDASIIVLHVVEPLAYRYPEALLPSFVQLSAEVSQAAKQSLDGMIGARRDRGVALEPLVRDGIAWEQVGEVARERQVDLVIVGTHGRRGLARALLGSVAEMVIRTVDLPVLAVHGKS